MLVQTQRSFVVTAILWRVRCCAAVKLDSSAGHFRKLRTQGFGLRIWEPISIANICGFAVKIEIYRKSANQQYRWDHFFAISKKICCYDPMYRHI